MDYYDLLGVGRDADAETIRKAFHAAARDCHPDISDAPDAERHFRHLAEAYSVLSKPGPRLLYDRYGYRGRGNSGFDDALWEGRERAPRGDSVHASIEIRPFEADTGTRRVVRFHAARPCADCGGRGAKGEPDPACPACGGTGKRRRVSNLEVARLLHIEACADCGGTTCATCEGTGLVVEEQRLRVRVPRGVEDGAQLRVAGEGDATGPADGLPGDLIVQVRVQPEPRDLRAVRYVALALFVGALILLIAYLS